MFSSLTALITPILSAHARRSTVQSRREYHNKAERERTKKINGLIQVRHSVVIGPPSQHLLMFELVCVLRNCVTYLGALSQTRHRSYRVSPSS